MNDTTTTKQEPTVRNNAGTGGAINGLESVPTNMSLQHLVGPTASPALQIMLDPVMYEKAKHIAGMLAKARGFTPKHLIDCPEACFAVVIRSLTWKLDPFAVAQSTFQIPGTDRVGYEGKLIQAILENSGKLEGNVRFDYFGDWDKIEGVFEFKQNNQGKPYPVAAWPKEDEDGLGVVVSCQVKGEVERREFRFNLKQAYPRNSTLWATDPRTQLGYTAVRRFANTAAPGLIMGVPFDTDDMRLVGSGSLVGDPPPAPTRGDFIDGETGEVIDADADTDASDEGEDESEPEAQRGYEVIDMHHETFHFADAVEAAEHLIELIEKGHSTAEDNFGFISQLRSEGHNEAADGIMAAKAPEPKTRTTTKKAEEEKPPAQPKAQEGGGPPAEAGDPGPASGPQGDMLPESEKKQEEAKPEPEPPFDENDTAALAVWADWVARSFGQFKSVRATDGFRGSIKDKLDVLLKIDVDLYNKTTKAYADRLQALKS